MKKEIVIIIFFLVLFSLSYIPFSKAVECPNQLCICDITIEVANETLPPRITILSPLNTTYSVNDSVASILINLSVTDANLDKTWFYNGTGNETYTASVNRNYATGSHNFTAWANDTLSNKNKTSVVFTVAAVEAEVIEGGGKGILIGNLFNASFEFPEKVKIYEKTKGIINTYNYNNELFNIQSVIVYTKPYSNVSTIYNPSTGIYEFYIIFNDTKEYNLYINLSDYDTKIDFVRKIKPVMEIKEFWIKTKKQIKSLWDYVYDEWQLSMFGLFIRERWYVVLIVSLLFIFFVLMIIRQSIKKRIRKAIRSYRRLRRFRI